MDQIKVKGWRVIDTEGSSLTYVPPEYHPTYWEIPKWYYKGRYVYTSCIRIDVDGSTSIFIDGMTPLMEITVTYDGTTINFKDIRSIYRARINATANNAAVSARESDEYVDVLFTGGENYRVVYGNYDNPNLNVPLQADVKPKRDDDGRYVYTDPIPFKTGTWLGGKDPIERKWRYKQQQDGKDWTPIGDWIPQGPSPESNIIQLTGTSKADRVHIESVAIDANGVEVYNNGARKELSNPYPIIEEKPKYSVRNLYVPGSQVTGFGGAFSRGIPPLKSRMRWQYKNTDGQQNLPWVNLGFLDPLEFIIPDDALEVRVQFQVREDSVGRNTNSVLGWQIVET